MEEVILKCAEFGVLGVIVLILPTALNSLTAKSNSFGRFNKPAVQGAAVIDNRVNVIEGRLSAIETSLGEILKQLKIYQSVEIDNV